VITFSETEHPVSRSNDHSLSVYSMNHHHPTEEHLNAITIKRRLDGLTNDEIKIKNRVNLLETEEKRILKKVEETRVRAAKIKSIKSANEQNYLEKMQLKDQKDEQVRQL